YCKPQAISEVLDRNGDPMDISGADCHQAVEKEVADAMAWTLQQDLEDPKATGKGKTIPGHPAGGKTGTSGQQFHASDGGFTRQTSAAVSWGRASGSVRPGGFGVGGEMLRSGSVWGSTAALPTCQECMPRGHAGLPDESFPGGPEKPPGQSPDAAQK